MNWFWLLVMVGEKGHQSKCNVVEKCQVQTGERWVRKMETEEKELETVCTHLARRELSSFDIYQHKVQRNISNSEIQPFSQSKEMIFNISSARKVELASGLRWTVMMHAGRKQPVLNALCLASSRFGSCKACNGCSTHMPVLLVSTEESNQAV